MHQLQKELVTLVKAENINLAGKEITQNNKTTSELEISITNGKNIPEDEDLKRTLCRLIAKRVKSHLNDSAGYNSYVVLLVSKVESGITTKRKSTGYKFNSQELTAPFINIGKKLTDNDYVYGGSIFTKDDFEIICVLRDYIFIDTSFVIVRLYKQVKDGYESIGEDPVNVNRYDNFICHKMNVQEFYGANGTGKYKYEVLSHDILIASKTFELK